MTEKTYLLRETEVKLTGRKAKKQIVNKRSHSFKSQTDEMVEVTPVNEEEGTWKKWVRLDNMYEILNKE